MTVIDIKNEIDTKYYEGILLLKSTTQHGNTLLTLSNIKCYRNVSGCIVSHKVNYESMNFLIPNRRHKVMWVAQKAEKGDILLVEIRKETYSGKFTVVWIEHKGVATL